jgi:alkylation response protein AidB-like acyl-CoA dehydrogenase
MKNEAAFCRYCRAPLQVAQSRCRECGSWLDWGAHLSYPETLWVLVGLVIAVVAAAVAVSQAADARAERQTADQLKKDIVIVAANVTKMAFIVADGSSRFGGIPDEHLRAIRRYENSIRTYLPPDIDTDIKNTIHDLDEQTRRRNEGR